MSILKSAFLSIAVAVSAVAPLTASAQSPAVTAPHRVDVRAGPDGVYPVVAILPPRAEVDVYGCLEGYSWCDVGFGIDRGWIHSSNLRYYYQNRYVPFAGVATIVGIGLTGFFFDDYWRNNYRERNWYSDRDRWHRGPTPRYWNGPERDYRPGFGQGRAPDNRFDNRNDNRQGFVPNREPNRDANRGTGFDRNREQIREQVRRNDGSSGWSPGQAAGQAQQVPQPGQQQVQLAPVRPHSGQPGMNAPQTQPVPQRATQGVMQPPAQIAPQPPQRGAPPQGNVQQQQQQQQQGQHNKGDGQRGERKRGDNDEKKN